MDLLLSLSAVRAFTTCASEQPQRYYIEQDLALSLSVHGPAVASLRLVVLLSQQSGHRGLNPDALGESCPQRHLSSCWFCHPVRKTCCELSRRDSNTAAMCGLLGPWQTLPNPWQLTPAVAGVFIAKAVN